VNEVIHRDPNSYEKFWYGTLPIYVDHDTSDPLGGLYVLLRLVGAVTGSAASTRITPLGRWALAQIRAEEPRPIEASLDVVRLAELDADDAWHAARPWLVGRTPVEAAREILIAAVEAPPRSRIAAIELVDALGDDVLPVWRDMVRRPGGRPTCAGRARILERPSDRCQRPAVARG
jgi:hypothetical protein